MLIPASVIILSRLSESVHDDFLKKPSCTVDGEYISLDLSASFGIGEPGCNAGYFSVYIFLLTLGADFRIIA